MAFRTRRKHHRGVFYHPPLAPPPCSLVISKIVHSDARRDDETRRLLAPAGQFITFRQQPIVYFTNPSDITHHITCQPTWWRLSVCLLIGLDSLWTISCTCISHFSLQCCQSGWIAGGWSLKVISDAVSMSHAGRPNIVIRFLEWSNQNQSV